jgi:hypothetical protein
MDNAHPKDQARPFGPMRRKDREVTDRAAIDAALHAGKVLHLALAEENAPFVVPVFYAYDGAALYFHSAKAGTKITMLRRNPRVCFCVTLDHGIIEADAACDFEASHRTVVGFGRAVFVEDEEQKRAALDRIVGRFTDRKFDYPAANLKATAVVRIEVDSLTCKKHGL